MITTTELLDAIQGRMIDIGLTQRDVAIKAGMSQPHLSNLFNGKVDKPQFATTMKLCEAVGIRVQFIVPKVAK